MQAPHAAPPPFFYSNFSIPQPLESIPPTGYNIAYLK